MPEITCASPAVVGLISQAVKESGMSASKKHKELERWNNLSSCDDGSVIQTKARKGKGEKGKRAPSAYNIFTGDCMKKGKSMKQCAVDWKKQKAA